MSARAATRAGVRARRSVAVVDVAVVVALAGVALACLVPAFGGGWFVPAAAAGVVLGAVVGWAGAAWRWPAVAVAGATVLGYFLVAGPFVRPETTTAGVLPGVATLRVLAFDAVRAWKGFVTAPTPVLAFPELVVVPFLAGLVAVVLAVTLALRVRRAEWALLPLGALLVGMILLGTSRAAWPVAQGGAFAVLACGWLAWRRVSAARRSAVPASTETVDDRADARRLSRRRGAQAAVMVAAVAATVALAGPVVAGAQSRQVLRDQVEPPLDLRQYASPLQSFRRYVKDQEEDVLFTVDALPAGARLRLAVLDAYDGTVLGVAGGDRSGLGTAGSFELADTVFGDPQAPAAAGEPSRVEVTVGEYRGPWLPSPGVPVAVDLPAADDGTDRALYVNGETGTMLATRPLATGDTYAVTAVVPEARALADLTGAVPTRDAGAAAQYRVDVVDQVARSFVGTETDGLAQIGLVRDRLLADGVFSDGLEGQPPSPPGHGAARLVRLLSSDPPVGDDEQYAVAAALMVRSLGYSSRVVMGLYPEDAAVGGPVELRGTDVHAWLEVAVDGVGWVPVDVTPDEDNVPQDQQPRSNREPQPAALDEPPPPEEPEAAPRPPLAQEDDVDEQEEGADLGAYLRLAAAVGIPVLVLVGPLVLVAAAKARRRRRRRRAAHPVVRVCGGWREVADTALDLGAPLRAGATRRETAAGLAPEYGGPLMVAVADRADQVVFGSVEPTDAEVEAFWAEVDQLVAELRGGRGRWRRLVARFSVRSLRWRHDGRRGSALARIRGGRR